MNLIKFNIYCVKKITTEDFIKRAKLKWGDKYDYSEVEYVKNKINVKIICKKHGVFNQRPDVHLKSGCKMCSDDKKRMNIKQFITKANKIHKNEYKYNLTIYESYNIKVKIVCKKHGVFEQTPHNHLKGQGCPVCNGGVSYSREDFIREAKIIHGDIYDYSKSNYIKSDLKIDIICKKHGTFSQKPNNHINKKYGCPKCFSRISKLENKWLDSIGISENNRQYKIDKFFVDGYEPETKTVYEFYGDFWHGNLEMYNKDDINPINNKTFGELYKNTIEREDFLKSLGYNVISIWESEYKNI